MTVPHPSAAKSGQGVCYETLSCVCICICLCTILLLVNSTSITPHQQSADVVALNLVHTHSKCEKNQQRNPSGRFLRDFYYQN